MAGSESEILHYMTEKIRKEIKIILLCLIGLIFCLLASVFYGTQKRNITVERNRAGQGESEESIIVGVGKDRYEYNLEVQEKSYTKKELESEMKKGFSYLEKEMLKNNEDFDHITSKVTFSSEIPDVPIEVHWEIEDESLVDMEGTVYNEELKKGQKKTHVRATLSYEDVNRSKVYELTIRPKKRNAMERKVDEAWKSIKQLEADTRKKEKFVIFAKLGDVTILRAKQRNPWKWIAILLFIAIPLLAAREVEEEKQKREKVRRGAEAEYSNILWQFILLLEAGFTIPSAWKKITSDYKKKKEQLPEEKRYVYEQMLYAQHQMELGTCQEEVFAMFSQRMSLRCYAKLMTMFEQNITRGAKNMLQILKQEEQQAFADRCEQAKRLGEEADTKLLLPMGMMLLNILLLLMIPAYLQF